MQPKRYTKDVKAKAVGLVLEQRHSVADVARELGVGKDTLYFWVRRARQATRTGNIQRAYIDYWNQRF